MITSATTGYEKPHSEAYAVARRAAGNPDTLWMVGDNPEADVMGAERCGIPAILARSKTSAANRIATDLYKVIDFLSGE